VLSGFFGGLSGHQGALRSAFLLRCAVSPQTFIATGVACAVLVDVARLTVYGSGLGGRGVADLLARGQFGLIAAATGAAFCGAWLGTRFLRRMTIGGIRRLVGATLLGLAVALAAGFV
jgi:hypothetical protein